MQKVSDQSGDAGEIGLEGINGIAVVDDALIPLSVDDWADESRRRLGEFMLTIDHDGCLADFAERGFRENELREDPVGALEALTDPLWELGEAFILVSKEFPFLGKRIDERHSMRRLVDMIGKKGGCHVKEYCPEDEIDVSDCELVFIDYYLDPSVEDGTRAVQIVKKIEEERNLNLQQQVVLMSSKEKVRTFRKRFRYETGIHGANFLFVAKKDMDVEWKVRAHLEMLSKALPHSRVIGEYIEAAKQGMKWAKDELDNKLDDLDLGDYAYIQKVALESNGQPLGEYLSWLFSSHMAALAFECEVRKKQAEVDRIEFEGEVVSPSEPSTVVATLYHDALFTRRVGPLGRHPWASAEDVDGDVPMVRLGDVFIDEDRSKAVVVLSADCDLAFSPGGKRAPVHDRPVLVIMGVPRTIWKEGEQSTDHSTEGMERAGEVYRVDWQFSKYRMIPLGQIKRELEEGGFDLTDRDRLRPLYALQLQHEFSAHMFRVGHPIMPPLHRKVAAKVFRMVEDRLEQLHEFDDGEVFATYFKGSNKVRITPSVAGELEKCLRELLKEMEDQLHELQETKVVGQTLNQRCEILDRRIKATARDVNTEERWIKLLGDCDLPKSGNRKKLMNGLCLVYGENWPTPSQETIVFQVTDNLDVKL